MSDIKKDMSIEQLVLWDTDDPIDIDATGHVLWRSFDVINSSYNYSLPELVEQNANSIRDRYLSWIQELGLSDYGKGQLLDLMEIRPGFSYWWMTTLSEKSYGKSPHIYDILRLFVFEDLCKELRPKKIIINTSNQKLSFIIKSFCKAIKVKYEIYLPTKKMAKPKIYFFLSLIAEPFKSSCRILIYYFQRASLKQNIKNNISDQSEVLIVDYLFHLDRESVSEGTFRSNYWTVLVDKIRASKLSVSWLHHYVRHAEVTSSGKARSLIKNFNKSSMQNEKHFLIDAGLNLNILVCVFKDYIKLIMLFCKLRHIQNAFNPSDSKLFLWPLYRDDWVNSMLGSEAVWNCFILNLLQAKFVKIKSKKLGIYLQENQGWEAALIYFWKHNNHGKLIGVPHTTIQFWDLRYQFIPDQFKAPEHHKFLRPNVVAINGQIAKDAYIRSGYPKEELVEVEALRYLYLNKLPSKTKKKNSFDNAGKFNILVLGCIIPAINEEVIKIISKANKICNGKINFYLREHPGCSINLTNFSANIINITNQSFIELLDYCDVVITGGGTSAAIDAYYYGSRIIRIMMPKHINMCPLRGLPDVIYIKNEFELVTAINSVEKTFGNDAKQYFYLDKQLLKWQELLLV